MLKRLIKVIISSVVYFWDGAHRAFQIMAGRTPPARTVVLYYHGISDREKSAFIRQMRYLSTIATPTHCSAPKLKSGMLHAAVTFDDGFISVVKNALPTLRDLKIPSTIFVPSGYLGAAPGWVKNPRIVARKERIVSDMEIKELSFDPFIEIGSHTVTHPRLNEMDTEGKMHELLSSKKALESIIGKPVELFSFPHGSVSPDSLKLARNAGYKRVFGIQPSLAFEHGEEFFTGRVAVDPHDWPIEFTLKVKGAYRWLART